MKKIKQFWKKLKYWQKGGIIGLVIGILFSFYLWVLFENFLFLLILFTTVGGAILGCLWEFGKNNKLELKGKNKVIIYGYFVVLLVWLLIFKNNSIKVESYVNKYLIWIITIISTIGFIVLAFKLAYQKGTKK